jgi:hypothetical protein
MLLVRYSHKTSPTLGLLSYPEDGSSAIFRNFCNDLPDYTVHIIKAVMFGHCHESLKRRNTVEHGDHVA